jgi:hypothetical protein
MAIAMANLDRLPDTPENHVVRKDTAMGQTVELTQWARAATSTSITSSQSHHSYASEHPSHQHRDDLPHLIPHVVVAVAAVACNTSGVMETKNLPCHHIALQSIHD